MSKMIGWVALAAVFGAAAGCTDDRVVPPMPHAQAATATAPDPPKPVTGWRDLTFGMNETDVERIVDGYRKGRTGSWDQTEGLPLPIVRLAHEHIDHVLVDRTRFHHWMIRDLDETTESLHAWHDRGKLVALLIASRGLPGVFLAKARASHGAPPAEARFGFLDERSKMGETRSVAYWRETDATALVWADGATPTTLLWSNPAMDACAAEYQTSLDAEAMAARLSRQARDHAQ